MAILRYVIFAFSVGLCAVISIPAVAGSATPSVSGSQYLGCNCNSTQNFSGVSLQQVCGQVAAAASGCGCNGGGYSPVGYAASSCTICVTGQNAGCFIFSANVQCPAGSTYNVNTQVCDTSCADGQVLKPDGSCAAPGCESKSQQPPTYAWYKSTVGGATVEGSYCDGECMVGINPAPTGTSYNNSKEKLQRYEVVVTAAPCTVSNKPNDIGSATPPPEPPKRPVCAAGEGVLTSTSGTIACVPAGVPSAQTPTVNKSEEVTTYPDGSQKKRETTYTRDPVSQVQDTNVKETITSKPDGQPGAAGTPGVVDQKGTQVCSGTGCNQAGGSGSGSGNGSDPQAQKDLCEKNPTLDLCQNKLAKDDTLKGVKESADKIRDSVNAEGFDAKTHLPDGMSESDSVKNDLQQKKDDYKAALEKFGTASDLAAGYYEQFKEAMGGWFDPVPSSSCSAFDAHIGPWVWHFDHCPVAAKIAEIGAYCMWVMLVFGIFAMVTREGK